MRSAREPKDARANIGSCHMGTNYFNIWQLNSTSSYRRDCALSTTHLAAVLNDKACEAKGKLYRCKIKQKKGKNITKNNAKTKQNNAKKIRYTYAPANAYDMSPNAVAPSSKLGFPNITICSLISKFRLAGRRTHVMTNAMITETELCVFINMGVGRERVSVCMKNQYSM